jgi:hypothetical protein
VEPLEIELDRNRLVSFDGRVLEIFGAAVRRFHVSLLTVTVPPADKKGMRNLTLTQSGYDVTLSADEAAMAALQPVLSALRTAGVNVIE